MIQRILPTSGKFLRECAVDDRVTFVRQRGDLNPELLRGQQ